MQVGGMESSNFLRPAGIKLPSGLLSNVGTMANAASAPTMFKDERVLRAVRVSMRTLGLLAVSVSRTDVWTGVLNVLLRRYRAQMIGINATSHTANVIKLQSLWNRTDVDLVRNPMSLVDTALFISRLPVEAYAERTIARTIYESGPEPATTVWLWSNVFPKPFNCRKSLAGSPARALTLLELGAPRDDDGALPAADVAGDDGNVFLREQMPVRAEAALNHGVRRGL